MNIVNVTNLDTCLGLFNKQYLNLCKKKHESSMSGEAVFDTRTYIIKETGLNILVFLMREKNGEEVTSSISATLSPPNSELQKKVADYLETQGYNFIAVNGETIR